MSSRSRKGKGVASSSSTRAYNDTELLSEKAQTRFDLYRSEVASKVYEPKAEANNLRLKECFSFQGLYRFITLSCTIYTTLVRQFLANAHMIEDDDGSELPWSLRTRVNGVDFTFTPNDVAAHFRIKMEDDQVMFLSQHDIPEDVDWNVIENDLSPAPEYAKSGLKATCMRLQCRIIHRVLARIIMGKSAGLDQVSKLEQYLIWVIDGQRYKITWAHFIFNRIEQGPLRKSTILPYGYGISKLIKANGVNTTGAPKYKFDEEVDFIGTKFLERLGFEKNFHGYWVEKARPPHVEEELQQQEPPQQEPPQAPQGYDYQVPARQRLPRMPNLTLQERDNIMYNMHDNIVFQNQQLEFQNQHLDYHSQMFQWQANLLEPIFAANQWAYNAPPPFPVFQPHDQFQPQDQPQPQEQGHHGDEDMGEAEEQDSEATID